MTEKQFEELPKKVGPHIQKQSTRLRAASPAKIQLQMSLRLGQHRHLTRVIQGPKEYVFCVLPYCVSSHTRHHRGVR